MLKMLTLYYEIRGDLILFIYLFTKGVEKYSKSTLETLDTNQLDMVSMDIKNK